jgi:quinol monooxygenase YgiN
VIAVIATIKAQADKGAEFEAVISELAGKVRSDEPGNKLYQVVKSRTEADTYKVLELYVDQDAVAAHRAAPHFRELGRKMGAFMDGAPSVEVLDTVD